MQIRMRQGFSIPDSEKKALTAADFGVSVSDSATPATAAASAVDGVSGAPEPERSINLFADSYVPSFFRSKCIFSTIKLMFI